MNLVLFGCALVGMVSVESTVVSLYTKGSQPSHINWNNTLVLYPMRIKDQAFLCAIDQESEAVRSRRDAQTELKAAWAPLTGYTWDEPDLHIEFNKRIESELGNFEISAKSENENELWYIDPDYSDMGYGTTDHVSLRMKPDPTRWLHRRQICRPGDVIGLRTIAQTYANGTAKVMMANSPEYVNITSVQGCRTDGVVKITDVLTRQDTGDEGSIEFLSKLFFYHESNDPDFEFPVSLLGPLAKTCLIGELHNQQVEYCFPGRFRLLQHRNIPVAVDIRAKMEWEYIEGSKQVRGHMVSSTDAKIAAGFLSDHLQVNVGKTSARGVGGSFNPVGEIERVFGGILVFDQDYPEGCLEGAFHEGIIPSDRPWIAVLDRGGCMFQEKGLVAQKKGASGVIVINSQNREMIAAMASLPGKQALDIPMVLLRSDHKTTMKNHIGEFATIKPVLDVPESSKIEVGVNFFCDQQMFSSEYYSAPCRVNDPVLIRREGDQVHSQGFITEVLNYGVYKVGNEEYHGYQLFRDGHTPCTAQLGTYIQEVTVDGARVDLNIHSALLCRSPLFREDPVVNKNVVCMKSGS